MTRDYGSDNEHDAARYERHNGERYDDGPDARELAEFAAEMRAERVAAIRCAATGAVAS